MPPDVPDAHDPADSGQPCHSNPAGIGDRFAAVYAELHALARRHLGGERSGHTLQPTALIHEAFLRLATANAGPGSAADRRQFLALAARAMRQVLVDHARRHRAGKRSGGSWRRVTLHQELLSDHGTEVDVVALHGALERLAALDPNLAQIVELRFFGGLGIDETAALLGVSDRTVDRHWRIARGWLARELQEGAGS